MYDAVILWVTIYNNQIKHQWTKKDFDDNVIMSDAKTLMMGMKIMM